MPAIRLSPSFFRKELDVYGDWTSAFVREVLQNAVDAGSTTITVTIDTDRGRATIADDGCGMTREVIDDVFFAVGETTKDGADTVGGFGRARIIICLAQRGYVIRTGNIVVRGGCRAPQGTPASEYHLTQHDHVTPGHPDWVDGTIFEIDLIDGAAERMASRFRSELYDCTLEAVVTVDGARVHASPLPARARRILRDDQGRPWAKVYVVPDRIGRMLVRVSGLHMFSRYIAGDTDVIVELTPRRARSVLAASRDTLRGEFRGQLDEFVALLESNQRAALRPDAPPLRRRVGTGRVLSTHRPASHRPDAARGPQDGPAPTAAADGADNHTARQLKARARAAASDTPGARLQVVPREELDHVLPFDTYLLAASNDTATRALVRDWSPEHWTDTVGSRRRALLETWTAAVAYAMDRLLELCPAVEQVDWTPGWTFDDDVDATCLARPEATVLALRPVDRHGRTAYRISHASDRWRLLCLAVHEVCHVVVEGHNETFANVQTELMALVDSREADRRMQDRSF